MLLVEVAGRAEKYLAGRSKVGHVFGVGEHRAIGRSVFTAFFTDCHLRRR